MSQQEVRQLARVRAMVDELAEDHLLTAKMIHELAKRLPDVRGFSLKVMAASSEEGKELGALFGESAKMVRHPKLGDLLMPKRLPLDES